MPRRALKVCPCLGCTAHPGSCPQLVDSGRCARCSTEADRSRGTAAQRGYGPEHERRFRQGVLARDPRCVCTDTAHGHPAPCRKPSTVADHWPLDKRALRARGMDDHDPAHGRGLCASCHGKHTSDAQPGGWNQR